MWVPAVERWKDRIWKNKSEGATGKGLNEYKKECVDRESWRLFCCGYLLGVNSWKEQGIRNHTDKQLDVVSFFPHITFDIK